MDQQIKKLLVDALRSGDYEQGRFHLRSKEDKFCVLGVLCNLHAQQFPKIAKANKDKTKYMGSDSHLPKNVRKWAGLSLYSTKILTYLNDIQQFTFTELANYIEEEL